MALEALRRVRDTDAYANLLLPRLAGRAGLDARDAALATELTYGTLRMRRTCDWAIEIVATRDLDEIEPDVLDVIRLGAYQLLFTSIPSYAAVSDTVAALRHRGARSFANAVLRRLASEKDSLPWPTREGDLASYLELRHSHPRWVVERWLDELGPRLAEEQLAAGNVHPGVGIRVRRGHDAEAVRSALSAEGLDVDAGRFSDAALRVRGGGEVTSWPGFDAGAFAVADESSILVAEAAVVGSPERVLDLCAGPGGKTVHLAEHARHVVALDVHPHRARLVRDAVARLGPEGRVDVVCADGTTPPSTAGFDAVLVDAPCSGLGVLRRRPEARWRIREEDVERLADLQVRLLVAANALVRPGGTLVYAVCTLTRAETTSVTERFLAHDPRATAEVVHPDVPRAVGPPDTLQLLPSVHGTDAMFVARFRRTIG